MRASRLKGIAEWLADGRGHINAMHQNLIALGDSNIDAEGLLDQTFLSEDLCCHRNFRDER